MTKRSEDKGRLPPFVPLDKEVMDSPAWRATSHGARNLYISLKRRWSFIKQRNNGRLFLSQRDAEEELGSSRDSISRWYRELEHYGFIVMTNPGGLGVDGKGKAPHWRLTEANAPGGRDGNTWMLPTKDYLQWVGARFQDDRGEVARKRKQKQNPGPEIQARVARKSRPVLARKSGPLGPVIGPEIQAIHGNPPGPEIQAVSRSNHSMAASLTWRTPSLTEVTDPTELVAILAELPNRDQLATWSVFRSAARAADSASVQPTVHSGSSANGSAPQQNQRVPAGSRIGKNKDLGRQPAGSRRAGRRQAEIGARDHGRGAHPLAWSG
jgi:hypothetical protein